MNGYSPDDLESVERNILGELHELNGSLKAIGYNFVGQGIDYEALVRLTNRRADVINASKLLGVKIDSPEKIV